jgi:cytochrome d ubiquinol oxidase subunit II
MLETIWFFLWGILWAFYFMLDGYDLGLGTLLPFLAKTEKDRKQIYAAMGPHWDGNEVWLITAGGVTFAAFPTTYAVMFSGLYTALMLILFSLIIRGVSFVFQGGVDNPGWRKLWDTCLAVGSFFPALLLGVAFGNIFEGLPLDAEGIYQGTLFTLLNPYGLLGGLLFLFLFLVHGAIWGAIKTDGDLQSRLADTAGKIWWILLVTAVMFLLATERKTDLYKNYLEQPVLFVIPALAVVALILVKFFLQKGLYWKAWFASAATIVSCTMFGVVGLFPRLLPSSLNPEYSLTAFNSSSSPLTLKIMLGVALTFVPIVILYQFWAYRLFKEKLEEEDVAFEEGY